MPEITPELVARLRELDKKASPAPWYWDEDQDTMVAAPRKENGLITQEMGVEEWLWVDNAERNEIETNINYLLALRNLAKSLLDDHDRLEAENKKLRERLEEASVFRRDLVQATGSTAWDKGYEAGYADCHEYYVAETKDPELDDDRPNPYKEQG